MLALAKTTHWNYLKYTDKIIEHNSNVTKTTTDSNIPSETDFWAKHVEALETCSICMEPFGGAHVALRFTGKDVCSHIFGRPCLREWTETANQNANKCPICRHLLWKTPDPLHITNIIDDTDFDAEEFLADLEYDSEDEFLDRLMGHPQDNSEDDSDWLSDSEPSIYLIDEDLNAEQADDEAMTRMLNSISDAQESDEDDNLDTTLAENTRTISLKTLNRENIDCLLDDLYSLSAPSYLMPTNAGMSHIRERMEQCIDVALLGAGFTESCQIAPGLLDSMLLHFHNMVLFRRAYSVSESYLHSWKDTMLAYIEREEPGPFEPRAPTPENAGRYFNRGFGGIFGGFASVPTSTAPFGTSNFGRPSGFGANGTFGFGSNVGGGSFGFGTRGQIKQ